MHASYRVDNRRDHTITHAPGQELRQDHDAIRGATPSWIVRHVRQHDRPAVSGAERERLLDSFSRGGQRAHPLHSLRSAHTHAITHRTRSQLMSQPNAVALALNDTAVYIIRARYDGGVGGQREVGTRSHALAARSSASCCAAAGSLSVQTTKAMPTYGMSAHGNPIARLDVSTLVCPPRPLLHAATGGGAVPAGVGSVACSSADSCSMNSRARPRAVNCMLTSGMMGGLARAIVGVTWPSIVSAMMRTASIARERLSICGSDESSTTAP